MLRTMLPYAIAIFALDRLTKWWVVDHLNLREIGYMEVWPPFLNFAMAWNHGINFGLFNMGDSGRWVLIVLSLVIVAAVLWWMREKTGWLMGLGVGAVVGGALGNVWDRMAEGAVADFLNMSCCGIQNPFAFNVADIAIFAGAAILVIWGDRDVETSKTE